MSRPVSQLMSLTNSRRSLNTLLLKIMAFFSQKAASVRPKLGQNQDVWRQNGDMNCQGNLTFCRSTKCGHSGVTCHFLVFSACGSLSRYSSVFSGLFQAS